MGLDITAYEKVERMPDIAEGQDPYPNFRLYQLEDFADRSDGLEDGVYASKGITFGFRAGSYSGYNAWRADLCRLVLGEEPETVWANPDRYTGKPFVELIHFADNEGFIGPKTSAKLAADFDAFHLPEKANVESYEDWFRPKYADWSKAFHLAANTGVVKLH